MEDAGDADPVEQLLHLWQQGQPPALDDFVADLGDLDAKSLVALLRVDQAGRCGSGTPILAESYLQRYPVIASDPEAAIELIFNEFVLSTFRGGVPDLAEFVRRFPVHAATLRKEIDWYRAATSRCSVETLRQLQVTAKLEVRDSAIADLMPASSNSVSGEAAHANRDLPNPFGRYRILGLLGRGGMGAVYAAYDPQLDRQVALKVPDFATGDKDVISDFIREARIAAHFHDAHLCPVYEVGDIEGIYYLTMPVIDGKTLANLLQTEGPLHPNGAVRIATSVARALEVAHSAGVIHRDLTAANIFLNSKGQPIITDFGLARQTVAPGSDPDNGPRIAGTPAYMAPEQINGDLLAIGPATDVYALGVVLYEMLTGTRPFNGPLGSLLVQIMADDPEPPSRRRAGIDGRLSAICYKALTKKPGDRYATMADFAGALDAWLREDEQHGNQSRPKRAALAVAAVLLATAAGLSIWQPWKPPTKPESSSPAVATRDPEAALACAELAWRLNNGDDLERAVEESTGALRLDDRCVSALLCRANSLLKKKNPPLAVEDLQRALAIDPASHEAMVDLAWALNDLNEFDKALAQATHAIMLKPDSSEAHNQAGWAHFKQGLYREAIADFTTAIRHNPRYSWAYRNRSRAYKEMGQDAQAKVDESTANNLDLPGSPKN